MKLARNYSLPEGTEYLDSGCDVSASCLECPLAKCKLENPQADWFATKATRDRRVIEFTKKGVPVRDIAKAVNMSQRSVYKVIQQGGPSPAALEREEQLDMFEQTDPCLLELHSFKVRQKNAPAFRQKVQSAVYPKQCRTCGGDMCVDFRSKTASCVQCSRLWGQVELGERSA